MRGYSRVVAPGIPLVSISVSFASLRFLSWAEPRALPGKAGEPSAFAGPAFADRRQHPASKTLRLLPWAQAVPLDGPVTQRRPPRVMDLPKGETAAAAAAAAAASGDARGTATSAALWRDCQLEAMRSLHHPWTLGLANGSTGCASFKRYVAQDAYFLRAFAKAYAYALIKVEDEEGIRAFHSLIGSVVDELSLHASYATKWGIDIHNVPPPVKETSEYVDFLLDVASDPASSVAQVLASMAPCMRLYAFLGKELRRAFPAWRESAYAEWVETYSSEEFEAAAALVESLLDKYSVDGSYPSLLVLYRQAMELEHAFFAAQSQGTAEDDRPAGRRHGDVLSDDGANIRSAVGNARQLNGVHGRVALLCVDFDDTLTDGDTTSLLVKTAEAHVRFTNVSLQRDTPAGQAAVRREWEGLTSAFLSKWVDVTEESIAAKLADGACTADPGGPVDRQGLEEMLRRLEKVDLDSVARVADSKVLRGITRERVRASLSGPLRSSWKMRPGVARCLSRSFASTFETHVVSINWSRDVITSILSEALAGNFEGSSSSAGGDAVDKASAGENNRLGEALNLRFGGYRPSHISSNDLLYDEHGLSTGEIGVNVPGSFGKRQRFLDLASAAQQTAGGVAFAERSLTVYVGDSVTDLLAMLDADVGIVVGNSGSFERIASAFGIPIRPLASAYDALDETGQSAGEGASSDLARCVYRVDSWAEIEVFLFGDGTSQPSHG